MFNITETEDQKVYFTSDLHLDHEGPRGGTPLWVSRGYTSPKDMSRGIIQNINEVVRENDILFNLGDLCLNCSMETLESYLNQIRCKRMYCLLGNHPNPHYKAIYMKLVREILGDRFRPDMEVFPLEYKNMTYLNHLSEIIVNGQVIILCHYALQVWDKSRSAAWALCGHSHGGLQTTVPTAQYGKILDVGVDVFKRPVSFGEIKKLMDTKPLLSVDHH